ncbi:MAG TPA: LPS export ABC transporter ATP-binding protein [Bacteroidetes bacterium]|nr:LPS export ABC transporter ATP-binding protein [Bacteroidota bacterium]HCN36636.1 LPS export ABC transporter ATP-binding protein [Bacteroidota bacterium]
MAELKAKGLFKTYKKRTVVNNVSLHLKNNEVVGLLGPNGAGKTTTFYMICGLVKPDDGIIEIDFDDISKMPMYKRSKLGIGYLPQEPSVFRKLTVAENIKSILQFMGYSKSEIDEKTETLLNEFNINHIRDSKGMVLSGGERRRTEIARALASDPKFILLDEPFAGIDPIAAEDIMKIILKLKNKGIGVLITDHNVHETLSIVDRAYILIDGKIFRSGSSLELANDEMVKKFYLGESFSMERYLSKEK